MAALILSLMACTFASAARSKQSGSAATRIRRAKQRRATADDAGIEQLPLHGKLAVVTGGGRGIGAAVARALAQRGCRVVITYRTNADAAADTVLGLPGDGHAARQCDVTEPDAVAQLFADLEGVDIVINNAAIYEESKFLDASYEDWQRVWRATIEANLIGPANVLFHAGRAMARRGGGVRGVHGGVPAGGGRHVRRQRGASRVCGVPKEQSHPDPHPDPHPIATPITLPLTLPLTLGASRAWPSRVAGVLRRSWGPRSTSARPTRSAARCEATAAMGRGPSPYKHSRPCCHLLRLTTWPPPRVPSPTPPPSPPPPRAYSSCRRDPTRRR